MAHASASGSLYPPPPYNYEDNNTINIVFRTASEVLQELLPPPLLPNPENLAFFYIGEFNVASPIKLKYKEAGIGIPVIFDGKLGNYFVYLYLDTATAIVAGREIFGWPKIDAVISYIADKGMIQASVTREGAEIIRASMDASEQVIPIPDQMDVPAYNLKIIPSVKKNHPPDVLQLTSAISSSAKKALFRGKATLSFGSSTRDRLGDIPVLEILTGEQSMGDMSLDCGDVLVDYLVDRY